jgi:tetratricopeptide (TPR) repeat protein
MKAAVLILIIIFLMSAIISADMVIVMPYASRPSAQNEQWLSQGLAIMLTEELVAQGINMISWKVWQQYSDNLGIPEKMNLSRASSIKIASDLGADFLIIGSYEVNESTIKITAKLIDLHKGQYLCEISRSSEIAQLNSLIRTLREELADLLPTGDIDTSINQTIPAENPPFEALRALIKGLEQTDLDQKIAYLKEAIDIYPDYLRAQWELGKEYFLQHDYLDFETIAKDLGNVPGYDLPANFLLALSYYYQSRYEIAINILEGLLNSLPTDQVLNNLGLSFLKTDNFERSLWYLKKAQELQPEDMDYTFNIGYLYWKNGRLSEALEYLKRVVMKEPSLFEAHWLLSDILKRLGKEDEAHEEYLLARGYAPDLAVLKKIEEGSYPLEKVKFDIDIIKGFEGLEMQKMDNIPLKASLADFYLKQGELMLDKGDAEAALRELKKSVYLFPYSEKAHLLLAKIYSIKDQKAKAINELKMSLWSRENCPAYLELANVYFSLDQSEEALAQLEKCLELEPDNQEALKLKEMILSRKEK